MAAVSASRPVRVAVDGRWHGESLADRVRGELPLLRVWAAREFRIRYRQSALGIVWSVAQPVATLLVFGLLLSGLLHVGGDGLPYLSFAWAGLVAWAFTSTAVGSAVPSTSNAAHTVTRVYFPREIVPLAVVGAATVDLAISFALLLVVAVVQGVGLSYTVVAVPVVLAVLVLVVSAICVFGAAFTVFVRDTRYVLPFALQFVFLASPIMYPVSLYPERWRWVADVNPFAVAAESVRDAVLRHHWPDFGLLAVHGTLAAAALVAAVVYTRSVEPRIVDVI